MFSGPEGRMHRQRVLIVLGAVLFALAGGTLPGSAQNVVKLAIVAEITGRRRPGTCGVMA